MNHELQMLSERLYTVFTRSSGISCFSTASPSCSCSFMAVLNVRSRWSITLLREAVSDEWQYVIFALFTFSRIVINDFEFFRRETADDSRLEDLGVTDSVDGSKLIYCNNIISGSSEELMFVRSSIGSTVWRLSRLSFPRMIPSTVLYIPICPLKNA